ncbi:MAG: hypothetical protein NZM27_06440 [Acetobacteraceae bacterium]|nr:hypothetical protein [Acetobacteraceae bacterium]
MIGATLKEEAAMLRLAVLAGVMLIAAATLAPAAALPVPRPDGAAAVQPAGGRRDEWPPRPRRWGWGSGDHRGHPGGLGHWGPPRPPLGSPWGWPPPPPPPGWYYVPPRHHGWGPPPWAPPPRPGAYFGFRF